MTSFQIHDDHVDVYENQKYNYKDVKNVIYNKFGEEKRITENRKVLGHLTNLQNNTLKWNINYKSPTEQQTVSNKENNAYFNDKPKKNGDKNILDKTCTYIPKYSENIISLDTPLCTDSSIEAMSVDCSTLKSKQSVIKQYDDRFDTFSKKLYRKDIHLYLLDAERRHRPQPLYMSKQPELSDNMRCILIDWLVSISDEYNFSPETLHLAVSYIDRFLSKMSVVRIKLQLVGVAAIMIAAKYEEIYPPDTAEFAFLTNDTYSVKQILRMEQLMLRALSFDLTTPTAQTFIDEYASQIDLCENSINMAMYLSELCLVESVHYTRYLPSEIAASSFALSRHTLNQDIWTQELEHITGYPLKRLFPIVKQQHKIFEESPNKSLQAVRTKYGKEYFKRVSDMTPRKLNYED